MPAATEGESLRRILDDDDKGRQPFQTASCVRPLPFHGYSSQAEVTIPIAPRPTTNHRN